MEKFDFLNDIDNLIKGIENTKLNTGIANDIKNEILDKLYGER